MNQANMRLTPDEKAVLEAYRKAKRRRQVLHVVPQEATVKIYTFRQEEAKTTAITRPLAELPTRVVDSVTY